MVLYSSDVRRRTYHVFSLPQFIDLAVVIMHDDYNGIKSYFLSCPERSQMVIRLYARSSLWTIDFSRPLSYHTPYIANLGGHEKGGRRCKCYWHVSLGIIYVSAPTRADAWTHNHIHRMWTWPHEELLAQKKIVNHEHNIAAIDEWNTD